MELAKKINSKSKERKIALQKLRGLQAWSNNEEYSKALLSYNILNEELTELLKEHERRI